MHSSDEQRHSQVGDYFRLQNICFKRRRRDWKLFLLLQAAKVKFDKERSGVSIKEIREEIGRLVAFRDVRVTWLNYTEDILL